MIAAIIQARMSSTRLPGKVMKPILGKPMFWHLISRIKRCKTLDDIILATTSSKSDDRLYRFAKRMGIKVYRGKKDDVLDRYYQAAKKNGAKAVVRITGDCPLMDPSVVDKVVGYYLKQKSRYDYISNVHPSTFPDGMDVEVFSLKALGDAWLHARLPSEREHVTPYIWKRPKTFRLGNIVGPGHFPRLRLTLDNPEDLILIRTVFKYLYPRNHCFTLSDIFKLFKKKPELAFINAGLTRNEGLLKSLEQDKLFLRRKRFTNISKG